ncbi:DUF3566 domain-containing protein [Pseudonocardia saturnea]
MNDTTSTPDEQPDHREPDRVDADHGAPGPRSAVATDEQAIADGTADGDGRPDGAADADPGARPAEAPGAVPTGATPAGAVPLTGDEQTVVDVPTAPTDAPTTQMRVPDSGNGHATGNGSVPGPTPVGEAPTPPRPTGGPAPAPGPIPGPGPEAAPPPPWHRTPGQNGVGQQQREMPVRESAPAGGLLDEGPTAFLRAPEPERGNEQGAGRSPVRAARSRAPRQAALQLRRLDPWSALKLALVLAVVLFFVWLVAVGVLYGVLDGIGVWDRLNGTYADLVSGEAQSGAPLISAGRVFGFAALVGAINSLLFAVAVTIAAFVYNVSADLVGGIEVTLSERD